MGRFFKLKQGPRSLHALGEWTQQRVCEGEGTPVRRVRIHVCTMGQWPAENSFLLRLLDRLGGVCRRAGGRSVGWSGGAAGLGYLLGSVPPRLGRLSRLGSWAGAGVGAEKRRLPRESRDTSGDIRRDGRQT